MPIELDHLILAVNDRVESLRFYTQILGLAHEGEDGPFSVLRVTPAFTILISASGTSGGQHLAFALSKAEFEETFARIASAGIPFGDQFNTVGSMNGPGTDTGARGPGATVYVFDPNRHLIEIRHYEDP